jgi:acetyltransferase
LNIEVLGIPSQPSDFSGLCSLVEDCVVAGASIGFVLPLDPLEVAAFWKRAVEEYTSGGRLILVARECPGGRVIASAQIAFDWKPNARHRAEVQKVLVLAAHRRKGIAAALMAALESAARARNLTLLCLDTSEGAGGAMRFYETLGYTYAGGIPGFAVDPDGTPAKNAIYYKTLT